MDRRGHNVVTSNPDAGRDAAVARTAFSAWLRQARESRGIDLDEIARITKIQRRTLERLETARFDELPADVFVRGFIRNYARAAGLDAEEAIGRYDGCGVTPGPAAAARVRAKVDAVASAFATRAEVPPVAGSAANVEPVAPIAAAAPAPAAAPVPVVKATAEPRSKGKKRGGKRRGKGRVARRAAAHTSTTPAATASVEPNQAEAATPPVEPAAPAAAEEVAEVVTAQVDAILTAPTVATDVPADDDLEIEITVTPGEPVAEPAVAAPVVVTPPRAFRARPTAAPTLVIDDDDPDSAERVLEERKAASKERRSFLPQALLDGDRGTRQGGLTLAVIILLIVATLTLSYLMRRPSSSGEGVTQQGAVAQPARA